MELSILQIAEDHLSLHNWTIKEGAYHHKGGAIIRFDKKENENIGLISYSSIFSVDKCRKKIYLKYKYNDKHNFYIDLSGRKKNIFNENKSKKQIIGIALHEALYHVANFISPNVKDFVGINWRSILAPVYHYSINNIINNDYILKNNELDRFSTISSFEKFIFNVIDYVWLKEFKNQRFKTSNWRETLGTLSLRAEESLIRNSVFGYCDLIIEDEKRTLVFDYKTGDMMPMSSKYYYNPSEALSIIKDEKHELHNYFLQLAVYCWLIDSKKQTMSIVVFLKEDMPFSYKFSFDHILYDFIDGLLSKQKTKIIETVLYSHSPDGNYFAENCFHCNFKLRCKDYFYGTKLNPSISNENLFYQYPVLLKIVGAIPDEKTIIVEKQPRDIKIIIINSTKHYLQLIENKINNDEEIIFEGKISIKDHQIYTTNYIISSVGEHEFI